MKRQASTTKNTPRPPSQATPNSVTTQTKSTPKADSQRELKPTHDDIRRRAYELYLERQNTGTPGSPTDDWARAERELLKR